MFKEKKKYQGFLESLHDVKIEVSKDFQLFAYPALNIAARYGNLELVKKFIDLDVNLEFKERCVLTEALYSGNPQVIQEIMKTSRLNQKSIIRGFNYFISSPNLDNFPLFLSYMYEKNILEYLDTTFDQNRLDMIDIILDNYLDTDNIICQKILVKACERNIPDLVSKITNRGIFNREAFIKCSNKEECSAILGHFLIFEEFKKHIFDFISNCFYNGNYKCYKIISEYLPPNLRDDHDGEPLLFRVLEMLFRRLYGGNISPKSQKILMSLLDKMDVNIKHEDECLITILVDKMGIREKKIETDIFDLVMDKIVPRFNFEESGYDRNGNNPLMNCIEEFKFYLYPKLKNYYDFKKLNNKGENVMNILVSKVELFETEEKREDCCNLIIKIINDENFDTSLVDSQKK